MSFFNSIGRGNISRQKDLVNSKKGINLVVQKNTDNGFAGRYRQENNKTFKAHSIVIGRQTGWVYYQPEEFMTTDGVLVLESDKILNYKHGLYVAGVIQKELVDFGYNNTVSAAKLKNLFIELPFDSHEMVCFKYMEDLIKELEVERIKKLEAYLVATGLNDYTLTSEEKRVLSKFRAQNAKQTKAVSLSNDSDNSSSDISWTGYRLDYLFDNIVQGKRLRKDDQVKGNLPFVMSGTTNTGISKFIGNNIKQFPANSITIDIFGSAFYRSYEYGMGDDTGAYWNEKKSVDKMTMLFYTASINKSLYGIYDYGHKLRSSRAKGLVIRLPKSIESEEPDYQLMSIYIRAIEKLVIKGVVDWKDKQIEATNSVI